jgi:protein-L-isoaspartate(D-aspartate) O-methyltransferase
MTDFAVQRLNMVDSQVRPSDVVDRRIPRAMLAVPREAFVPEAQKAVAYMDDHIPVAAHVRRASLLAPRVLAKLIQALEIPDDGHILDIGGATGYSAAILARLAKEVTALESDPGLFQQAKLAWAGIGATNIAGVLGPLAGGVADKAPFDAILINGGVEVVPQALLDQLKDGGQLAALRVERGIGRAVLWRRNAMQFDNRPLFDAGAPVLAGFERERQFVF